MTNERVGMNAVDSLLKYKTELELDSAHVGSSITPASMLNPS